MCRNMDPEADAVWNSLMKYDWSGGNDAAGTNAAAAAQSTVADEHLLDADFEEDDEPPSSPRFRLQHQQLPRAPHHNEALKR